MTKDEQDHRPPVDDETDTFLVVGVVLSRSNDAVEKVRSAFATAGFVVGPASGPTFSIAAPAPHFRHYFGPTPVRAEDGAWTTEQGDELPLDRLSDDFRHDVAAVAFERPAELHGFGTDP